MYDYELKGLYDSIADTDSYFNDLLNPDTEDNFFAPEDEDMRFW